MSLLPALIKDVGDELGGGELSQNAVIKSGHHRLRSSTLLVSSFQKFHPEDVGFRMEGLQPHQVLGELLTYGRVVLRRMRTKLDSPQSFVALQIVGIGFRRQARAERRGNANLKRGIPDFSEQPLRDSIRRIRTDREKRSQVLAGFPSV